jgi:hypothetical protein
MEEEREEVGNREGKKYQREEKIAEEGTCKRNTGGM